MLVRNLSTCSDIYTSNAYLCNRVSRKREGEEQKESAGNNMGGLLIDTGCDSRILTALRNIASETGRQPVSEVILTHSHYDHIRTLREIQAIWPVRTYAFSAYIDGVDQVVKGGEQISVIGFTFGMIHIPGHSTDSLCIYCPEEEILFSGDTPLVIWGTEGTYELPFVRAFESLVKLKISTIYPGHGEPITGDCNRILDLSLRNLRKSRLI
jgi:glyoxylase-like metal-dependent hydrolase (beta-lactamase superfamily II)